MEPIHIRLSQKQKTFAEYCLAFLKSLLNFKYLEKNDPHSSCISAKTVSEKNG